VIESIELAALDRADEALADRALAALEGGAVLTFPELRFPLTPEDCRLIEAGAAGDSANGGSKNVSYDPRRRAVKGTTLAGPALAAVGDMQERFGRFAEQLVLAIAPRYRPGLSRARASFRPVEIAGRVTSWRKDDRRRHVDAFPSSPTGGARILRVFANVDRHGTARVWRVGPDFESYAGTFLPRAGRPLPGMASAMALLGLTKSRRTLYDQTMLALHDAAKRDLAWQQTAPSEEVAFPPDRVWMVYTDQVPHAALSGRNALEQTFSVSPDVLAHPEDAPLAILSRLSQQDMASTLF
jgi:hypothetical protein